MLSDIIWYRPVYNLNSYFYIALWETLKLIDKQHKGYESLEEWSILLKYNLMNLGVPFTCVRLYMCTLITIAIAQKLKWQQ